MIDTVTLATKTKSEDTTATVQYTLVLLWLIMHFFIFVTSLETQVCKQVGLYQHCSDLLTEELSYYFLTEREIL